MNYNKKYLKYKKKYLNLKKNFNQNGGHLIYRIIPLKTILYRSAPTICNYSTTEKIIENLKYCKDTGKTGIYLGDTLIISIAMCLEYDKLLEIGIFEVIENIQVLCGKFAHRHIHPEKYLTKKGKPKFYIKHDDKGKETLELANIDEDENVSHVQGIKLLKMKEDKTGPEIIKLSKKNEEEVARLRGLTEIFLTTHNNDINKIKLVAQYKFNNEKIKSVKDLLRYLEANDYPFHINKYIEDSILIPFSC